MGSEMCIRDSHIAFQQKATLKTCAHYLGMGDKTQAACNWFIFLAEDAASPLCKHWPGEVFPVMMGDRDEDFARRWAWVQKYLINAIDKFENRMCDCICQHDLHQIMALGGQRNRLSPGPSGTIGLTIREQLAKLEVANISITDPHDIRRAIREWRSIGENLHQLRGEDLLASLPMEAMQREESARMFFKSTNRLLGRMGYETVNMASFYEVLMGGAFHDRMQIHLDRGELFTSNDWPMIMAHQIIHQACWTRKVTVVGASAKCDPHTDAALQPRMQVPSPAHGRVDVDMDPIDVGSIPRHDRPEWSSRQK